MSELRMAGPAWKLVAKQKIMPNDVIMLRQECFADGVKTTRDIATLLALDAACDEKCPQWNEFFISSITEHVFDGSTPYGSITEDQVDWLKKTVTRNGVVESRNEFEVLLTLLETAKEAPQSLCALAVDHVCRQIYKDGTNRRHPDQLTEDDIALLIYVKRLSESTRKFSLHEHLRVEQLGHMISSSWHETRETATAEIVPLFAS